MRFVLRVHGKRVAAIEAELAGLQAEVAGVIERTDAVLRTAGLFYRAGRADEAAEHAPPVRQASRDHLRLVQGGER